MSSKTIIPAEPHVVSGALPPVARQPAPAAFCRTSVARAMTAAGLALLGALLCGACGGGDDYVMKNCPEIPKYDVTDAAYLQDPAVTAALNSAYENDCLTRPGFATSNSAGDGGR